jgi:hypothetical protein
VKNLKTVKFLTIMELRKHYLSTKKDTSAAGAKSS